MIRACIAQPICAVLIALLAAPYGLAQAPVAPASPLPAQITVPPEPAAPKVPGAPLSVNILEGNNAVNSIPLLRSVAVVVEIRDVNDFPVEGAAITFTLPAQGPGGVFAMGGKTFSTRSDARGQAISELIAPAGAGKFQIAVAAAAGDRKGSAVVTQTNSEGSYVGPVLPPAPKVWYKRRVFWLAGGAAVAVIAIILIKHGSNSSSGSGSTIVITPGTPVFQ